MTSETPLELHLRRVIETQPGCLARLDTAGRFLAVNEAALRLLGTPHLGQVLGTSLLDRVPPTHEPAARAFLECVAAGEPASTELPLPLGDHARVVELHAAPLAAPVDGLDSLLCTFRDVTEHRRLEEALVEGAAREDALAEALAAERARLATIQAEPAIETARLRELEQLLTDARTVLEATHAEHEVRLSEAVTERDVAAGRALEATRAAHEREAEALREQIAALERAAAEAAERERELAARSDAAHDRSREAEEHAAAAERALAELRVSMDVLDLTAREAATRELELAASCEAEQARCREALDRAVAAERALGEAQVALDAAEAAVGEATAREHAVAGSYEAERLRWRDELAAVLDALDQARVEQRAIESQWQHASRLADAARLASTIAAELVAALGDASTALRRLLALLPEGPERLAAERALGSALEAMMLARRLGQPEMPPLVASVAQVVRALEPTLGTLLGPDVRLSVLAGGAPLPASVAPGDLETLVLLLAASQRGMLEGGTAAFEIGESVIDEDLAAERAVRSGPYVVVALHAAGPAVEQRVPETLVTPIAADDAWSAAGPALAAVHRLAFDAGGHLWLCREREDAVSFELYLPRALAATVAPGSLPASTETAA
jgi:PAS domain S-box-containing protein